MSSPTPTYKAILRKYETYSESLQGYYADLPNLLNDGYGYETLIGYMYIRLEQAQNRILYGGVVKVHRGARDFVWRVVNKQHVTRKGFLELYQNIFGKKLDDNITGMIVDAEKVRDKIIHGKYVKDSEKRQAICEILECSHELNELVKKHAGFYPFGSMRGFKGRADHLDNRTTKWVLRGLGFGVKA
ncbi:MAG: hypothetical protein ABGX82_12370 [Pseudomonas sp.]|uniref:hypothetical protein n=1 Tax=Pseudomonas sp. TaxID=306 RepID=UPI0032425587